MKKKNKKDWFVISTLSLLFPVTLFIAFFAAGYCYQEMQNTNVFKIAFFGAMLIAITLKTLNLIRYLIVTFINEVRK